MRSQLRLILVGMLFVTGCSPGQSDVDSTQSSQASQALSPVVADPIGPLDEFRSRIDGGLTGTTPTEAERATAALNRALAEHVAACMNSLGFDFIAGDRLFNSQRGYLSGSTGESDGPVPGSRAWAALYGFSISLEPPVGNQIIISADDDPNHETYTALSAAEKIAWNEALFGNIPEPDAEVPTHEMIGDGCIFQAKARYQPSYTNDAAFVGLRDDMNRLDDVIAGDLRMFELNVAWASCLADHGFAARPDRDGFLRDVPNEFNALSGQNALLEWDWEHHPEGPPRRISLCYRSFGSGKWR